MPHNDGSIHKDYKKREHRFKNVSDHYDEDIELSESESYFKQLFQNLNSNFAVHEIILDENNHPVDYRFLEVNSAFEKATGLKARDVVGKTAKELFPDTEQHWIEIFGEVALKGISTTYENYSKELDQYYELKLYSPKKGQFAMLATDVTERHLTLKKLQEAKEQFETLFELNPDAVNAVRLSDNKVISVNSGFTNLVGYTRDEVIGKTILELNLWVNPADRVRVTEMLKDRGHCNNFETRFRCKSGKVIVGIISARLIDLYGEKHILSVTRDISLRKEYETALVESEKLLKESQKIAGLGSYKINFETGKGESSEVLDAIFGIGPTYDKSIEGWIRLIHPDWQKVMTGYLQNGVIPKKSKFDKEYKIIRPNDQKEIWVHGLGKLLFDDKGKLLYMTGTIMDITGRKHSELIIQDQNTKLQKMNQTKDMLFSIIAHDLRSPFSTLINSNELLMDLLNDNEIEEARKWCLNINALSHRTYDLLNNLLDWFKVQTGQIKPEIKECNIKSLVEEILFLYRDIAKEKDIKIHSGITEDLTIKLDKEITKTIVRNLVNNAIKFTCNKGTVSISLLKRSSEVEIAISDTGVGIPEENLPYLFAVHEKKRTTLGTGNEKGTGLGLSICKDLVETQGGRIWAVSEVNKGSAFHFTIPLK